MFANCTFNMYKNTNDEHGTEASGVESNFKLPTTIANIESQAFIYAHLDFAAFSDSFKAITNLQKIGARAFYESRLQQGLTLPVGTYTIEKEAFIGAYTTGSTRPGLT